METQKQAAPAPTMIPATQKTQREKVKVKQQQQQQQPTKQSSAPPVTNKNDWPASDAFESHLSP